MRFKDRARCIGHEPCPSCRARGKDQAGDNLGIFPDGGKWCISCGYWEAGNTLSLTNLSERFKQQQTSVQKDSLVSLPNDFTRALPDEITDYLRRYEITDAEIAGNRLGWSPALEMLIFPVYDLGDRLLMWQGKDFSHKPSRPKAYTEGIKEDVFHVLGDPTDSALCVVEDIISSIKVSRVMPCMPLWGSVLSTKRILDLAEKHTSLAIWLDHDKQEYSIKRALYARPFFNDNVRVVSTTFDPKVYSTKEIARYVLPNTRPL